MHASKECDCENAPSDTVLQLEKTPAKAARGGKDRTETGCEDGAGEEKHSMCEPVKKAGDGITGKADHGRQPAKELTAQKGGTLTIKKGVIVTPSAKDIFSREKDGTRVGDREVKNDDDLSGGRSCLGDKKRRKIKRT